jgi:hypothetical protein
MREVFVFGKSKHLPPKNGTLQNGGSLMLKLAKAHLFSVLRPVDKHLTMFMRNLPPYSAQAEQAP